MTRSADNPYASPSASTQPPPESSGRGMPHSIRLMIGSASLFSFLYAMAMASDVYRFGFSAFLSGALTLPLGGGLFALFAVWRRGRVPRLLARAGLLLTALFMTFIAGAWIVSVYFSAGGGAGMTYDYFGIKPPPSLVWVGKLAHVTNLTAMALCLWVAFLALGRRSAVEYFAPGHGEAFAAGNPPRDSAA